MILFLIKCQTINNAVNGQLNAFVNAISPINNSYYQFVDNKYYTPNTQSISLSSENINIITSDSSLKFDAEVIFNLTDHTKNIGEIIEDLLICIDIPVLKPTEQLEYIEFIEYRIIENIDVIVIKNDTKKIMFQTNGDALYMNPFIYHLNPNEYHEMSKIDGKKIKVLYENTLIDIHRITLPLFLFKNKKSHLPIRNDVTGNILYMVVKIAPLKNLFKNKMKDIPLLNICLIGNFINLAQKCLHTMLIIKFYTMRR